ncbi:hypothetical protein GCM10025857_24140 [Alicyclobacillus contaminans]|uniref:MarR family winged helix-turn-helix transcriptional regulator n=1 Tax=Alicyclobacillus contaminans TaxID=392016 RepID=UPI0004260C0F|nr:MarR family winged helix-turn-helix transcriptional regulator [Alicyclobacillus contaminans]GMA51057.1 hypothetical protein GCM10025857_24140 [Alicyclobacillus contaminans]
MTDEHQKAAQARELLHSFRQVDRSMRHLMRIQADHLGLTPVQLLVVRILSESPDLSLNELSERVQLGCSTVSGVVKRLVECGVVERDRLNEDQRTVAIRLTGKGKQLQERAFGNGSLLSKALLKFLEFPDEDIQTLLKLHRALIQILQVDD